MTSISDYFSLKEKNELLSEENEKLRNLLNITGKEEIHYSKEIEETGSFYLSAKVIKNSVYSPYNFITLNKGEADGIKVDMAVVSDAGIVGVVANVSDHYSSVISLLNIKLGVNAKIKRSNFFGTLRWDREDYRYVILNDIPDHSSLYIGDEIVTGGFSSIFPEGLKIGTVQEFEKEQQNSFYKIRVKLSQDFKKLNNVYVIDYLGREERIQLEDSTAQRFKF